MRGGMMIKVIYQDRYEETDLSLCTVSEARDTLKDILDIPCNAKARLNGQNIKPSSEGQAVLQDGDHLIFNKTNHRGLFLTAALVAAIAITGGVFAYGYVNSTAALLITLNPGAQNFVDVSSNNSDPISWNPAGSSSGYTGNGTLWDIDTLSGNYSSDLLATVYLTNLADMKHVYRGVGLFLAIYNSSGALVDINNDGTADIADDVAFLSLNNGVVEIQIPGAADVFTAVLDHGFYITFPYDSDTWTSAAASPNLYIEMSQR
jgi:hypothetical protein